ncbi:TonB-dependent receptor [Christiangramia fulva]|uniref:TonB-dependent receptor n=1 Tax=Christiangramia fulva TaxID=2126553 RepID=A0A2R3Z3X2_9FLAO|nr:carboxypeptidase-like regulatory domain-containing protein [Christiangramia fulva]AVR44965.1 TonB-dependent receptor [Christiangramia fulva]
MRKLLLLAMFLASATIFAQGTVTGTVIDSGLDSPLPGANVKVVGTNTGAITDFDGKFSLNVNQVSGKIEISFVGYKTKTIDFSVSGGTQDLGKIMLDPDAGALDEILVTAYSLAIDRKTPVAVSNIKASDIALKLGTQEFPEILKTTPGIYATRQGGGYGDSRVNIRGFESENVAVLINGIPVNDMENGAVYWSNWAGLGDVTSRMQVQRGLGASKVAVPSIGGTINIVTKSTDAEEGGNVSAAIGNDGYFKYGMTYSTGLSDNGFAATVSASKIQGDGYVDGTEFEGYNYFVNLSKEINSNHTIAFNAFGAQQEHGQHYTRQTIEEYKRTEAGPKRFNADWGYKNGQVYHTSYNFYHKPQMSLNHYWRVNEKTDISTALYASFGSGGGRRTRGDKLGSDEYRLGGFDQPIDFDKIVDENIARSPLGASDMIYASFNSHQWYGILSTFKNRTSNKLTLSGGIDGRYYVGSHWYEITDLLGGDYWLNESSSDLNGGQALGVGDKFGKDYDGTVLRGGLFGQAEYDVNEDLNVFVAADISNTTYSVENFMKYAPGDPERKSDKVDFLGYGIKGGANYNLSNRSNIFANVGYFSKAPFLNNVFLNTTGSTEANKDAQNEKVFSAEIGYGFRNSNLKADINVYRTTWIDKAITGSYSNPTNRDVRLFYNILGVNALHQGVELNFSYNLTNDFKFSGMLSLGDWTWTNNVSAILKDENGEPLYLDPGTKTQPMTVDVYSEGLKVGDAAQTTFALGASYKFAETSTIYVDYNYAGDMYASYYVSGRTEPGLGNTWKAPAYGLLDLGIRHDFDFGPFDASLYGRINNALNTEYVSDANDQGNGFHNALVYYGPGRTYSVSLKLKF